MPDEPEIDQDDIDIFRSSIGPVRPLSQERVLPDLIKPNPVPVQTLQEQQQVLREMVNGTIDSNTLEMGDELLYVKPGIQQRLLQKLRRGQFRIEAELDLHGLNVATAKETVNRFLAGAGNRQQRCVRIIHGKGHGSRDGKPVIKNRLDRWLRQHNLVLAYCSARPVDGGTGAVYVLLSR